MERILKIKILIFLLFAFNPILAQVNLPKLITKQDLSNLRFISGDGRFSYYQNKSGKLFLSLNYKIQEVLGLSEGTQFEIYGSNTKEFLIISADDTFHQTLSPRKSKKLYVVPYGMPTPKLLGEGNFPRFQLNSTWASYYNAITRTMYFKNLISPEVSFFLELNNTLNKYFMPEAIMLSKDLILYTDVNKKGFQGLLLYDRINKDQKLIYKIPSHTQRLEICEHQGNIYLGEFSMITSKNSSKIYKVKTSNNKKSIQLESIYTSKLEDIGHMICDIENDKITFIKDYSKGTEVAFDLAELDVKSKEVIRLTEVKKVFQVVQMDERILIPFQGEYLVFQGKSNLKNKDNLEK